MQAHAGSSVVVVTEALRFQSDLCKLARTLPEPHVHGSLGFVFAAFFSVAPSTLALLTSELNALSLKSSNRWLRAWD